MKKTKAGIAAVFALALVSFVAFAIADTNNVVGYNRIDVPVEADVLVSVPFTQASEGSFEAATVTSTGVTVSDTLEADEYATLYYVRFTSGDAKGRWTTISSNTTGELVFEDDSFISDVTAGDTFEIYPHQTLGTLFPAELEDKSMEESVKHATLPFISTYKTQVLVYDGAAAGINKAAPVKYFYYNDAWRKAGSSLTLSFNDAVLKPDTYFVIRNENSDNELVFISKGNVNFNAVATELVSGIEEDVLTSTGSPVAVKLKDLNLGGTDAFEDSVKHATLPFIQTYGDRLLVFNNTGSIKNRAATTIYFYYDGAWRKAGAALTESFDDDEINPSEGFIIRKSTQGTGTNEWVNTPSY